MTAIEPAEDRAPAVVDAAALAALDDAARAISAVLSLDEVLQLIVDRVRELVDARYAALGLAAPDGRIERFITAGVDAEVRAAIGDLPHGRGLLGLIIRQGRSYRIPRIADHPDSSGFPPNHPPMTSFLGVPITSRGVAVGNLYLTDKQDAQEFSAADQDLVELFARHAAIAIDNARLHAGASRLAVADERERIGRDLHDSIIQSLYAVSLSLEDIPELMTESPSEAERRLDASIDALHLAIRDIRNFIYGLRPEALDGTQVLGGIAALATEAREGGLLDVVIDLDPTADPELSADEGAELLQLVREAISNASRHARAKRLEISLRRSGDGPELVIADDGVGFDPGSAVAAGHHGLANMRVRATRLGGSLEVASRPGAGTRIVVALPGGGVR